MSPDNYPYHTALPDDGSIPEFATRHDALMALRARAEQRRQLVTTSTERHAPDEMQRLVQELQVHQIELEMQYEELLLAQAEAQAARNQYVDLYDFAPVGYFTLTDIGLMVQLNLCGSQMLGTVRQRLVGRRFALFVAPADRMEFGLFLARVFRTDTTQSCELALLRDDGTPFYAQLEGLRSNAQTTPQCRLVVVDTTARRQATEALAASESRFRRLFADSSDAVVLLQGHQYVDCNDAALRLLGTGRKADIVGQAAWAHCPERQPDGCYTTELFRETVDAAMRTGSQRCVARMRRFTGEEIWMEAVLTPIEMGGSTPLVHIVWRDITAARTAQEELKNSQERLQLALEAAESGVWMWDVAANQLQWDANAQAVFGMPYHPEPVSFEMMRSKVHPDDLPALSAGLQQAVEAHTSFVLEHRICWPDGRVRHVAALGKGFYDQHDQQVRLIGIVRDVTPRREAEHALRQEKEFTESLLENTEEGIIALNREWRITAWNAAATRAFGQAAATVLGRAAIEVLPFLDDNSHQNLEWALEGERVIRFGQPFTHRPGHYDVYFVPLQNEDELEPSGVLIIIRDVTERNQLAEEATQLRLRQQQEVLAAILTTQETERKRIAEAIHNGLGQLLYATKLSLESGGHAPSRSRDSIKLLDEAIRTTRTISFELTPGILEDFGLRIALEELVKRLGPVGLPVHLHLANVDKRLAPKVEIAVYRIVQELLNNVMKHAGATEVDVHVAHENHRLEVSVEDNGCGFEPAALATQPLAGIGLSGVRNRVALLGSELLVKSRLGQGTIISFELDV